MFAQEYKECNFTRFNVRYGMRPKRNSFEIIGNILTALSAGGLRKTWVSYKCNLDGNITRSYLNKLLKMGFIRYDGAESLYYLTEQGREYINEFERLRFLLDDSDMQKTRIAL